VHNHQKTEKSPNINHLATPHLFNVKSTYSYQSGEKGESRTVCLLSSLSPEESKKKKKETPPSFFFFFFKKKKKKLFFQKKTAISHKKIIALA